MDKVLIVDDSEQILDLLRRIQSKYKFDIQNLITVIRKGLKTEPAAGTMRGIAVASFLLSPQPSRISPGGSPAGSWSCCFTRLRKKTTPPPLPRNPRPIDRPGNPAP